MLCRVEMPSNEQIFGRFYRYRLMHNIGGGSRAGVVGLPIVALVLIALLFTMGASPLVMGVVAVLAVGYLVFTMVIRPGQLFRAKPGAALQTEVTIFTETGFTRTVRGEGDAGGETSSMQYAALTRAVETGRDFYLFTGPSQALLFDKEFFTKGSPEELREMLQKKLGKKFKGKK